ncbi:GNAT family N-acetyltransferase [Zobellella maritima]|uniref:GNAT family N-acetyltransferase n=1 Tax=Zobellella maritima TaxID=2059725 RepID=UPI000E3069BF|nr:GNAT family N-acetyltransferase [Zobellella maritima]
MDSNILDKANIDNLTALWRTMGAEPAVGGDLPGWHACPGWPHRYWFDWGHEPASNWLLPARLPDRAMVPIWAAGRDSSPFEQTLITRGFGVCLEQRAMHLSLSDWVVEPGDALRIRSVTTSGQVTDWTRICSRAFGYAIDETVIRRISEMPGVRLLLAEREGEAVATALLYKTGSVIGVHQVGVPPEHQGQGIAYGLMHRLIAVCQGWGGRYITLQASSAGEGLYRRLGFEPRFMIRSYRRAEPERQTA